MMLTPTEQERLTIFTAAELARKHRALGLKLSHPEAVAYIADELLYGARAGRTLAELMGLGSTLLTTEQALAIVDTFLATPMRDARYIRRLAKIRELEVRARR